MLEVNKLLKIRKDNLYGITDRYILRELKLDLWSSKLFIKVEFYRETQLIFTREYAMGEVGDTDVNKLIDDFNRKLTND